MYREAIHQLDEAVAEVFAVMLNLVCTPEAGTGSIPYFLFPTPCLTASIHFSGTLEGNFALRLPQPTAAALLVSLIGMPPADIPAELCADTAAELCNMIAGRWKTRQSAVHAACHLSCPVVTLDATRPPPANFHQTLTRLYLFDGYDLTINLAVSELWFP